ncbi:MAG: hypothetical protein WD990_09255 [Acidimicrobiia bacterium]
MQMQFEDETTSRERPQRVPEGTERLHRTMAEIEALKARADGSLGRRLAMTVFGASEDLVNEMRPS